MRRVIKYTYLLSEATKSKFVTVREEQDEQPLTVLSGLDGADDPSQRNLALRADERSTSLTAGELADWVVIHLQLGPG